MATPPSALGMDASCGGCDTRWRSSTNIAHCRTCHLTFTSPAGFDAHRFDGRCRTIAEITSLGYEPNGQGHWRIPMPEDAITRRTA